jgi:hypothetical protein
MTARILQHPRSAAPRQFAIFLAAYVLYDVARWTTAGDLGPAVQHAQWVIGAERGLGIAVERSVQQALHQDVVMWLLSNVYLAAQLVVLPASLIWLYRHNRAIYRRLRDVVVATWLLAVPIYAAFPVAPPRLAGLGMTDTVSGQAAVALTGHSTIFYNPIAAVPSLHCGFAFAIGIAFYAAFKNPIARACALAWGPLVSLSVVATGNHYWFDIGAGVLVALAGFAAKPVLQRLTTPRLVPVPA